MIPIRVTMLAIIIRWISLWGPCEPRHWEVHYALYIRCNANCDLELLFGEALQRGELRAF